MVEFDKLIIGIPTWGEGDLQDDWEEHFDTFCDIDFTGKKVALFGLGDQDEFEDYFLDAMGTVYEQIKIMGGEVIGFWPVEDYDYVESKAVINGQFVGLGIDEDNQSEMTKSRITRWCSMIKEEMM
jgi:flavodoxin I